MWGSWALLQAEYSTIDFDYIGYGYFIIICEYFFLNLVEYHSSYFVWYFIVIFLSFKVKKNLE